MWLALAGTALAVGVGAVLLSPRCRRLRMQDAFQAAIRRGDLPAIRRLLARGVSLNWWKDGTPPLHQAVSARQPGVIRELLAAGADIEATGGMGFTALQKACHYGYADMVRLLLAHGASVDYTPNDGHFTRHPLDVAVFEGDADVVQALLDGGLSVEWPITPRGETALEFALALRNARCSALVVGPDGMHREDSVPLPADMAERLDAVIAVLRAAGARD